MGYRVKISSLLLLSIIVFGCKSTKSVETEFENKEVSFEYERTVPGVKLRAVFFTDTFNTVDSIIVKDTSGRGEAIVWMNKYNQLVVDCETKNETERITSTGRQTTQNSRVWIERVFDGVNLSKLGLILLGAIILIILLRK